MAVIGYAYYLIAVLFPGLGASELLGLIGSDSTLMEGLAYSTGLGLAIGTVVAVIGSSGLSLFGVRLAGVGPPEIYAVVAVGVVLLAAALSVHRRLALPRVTSVDLLVLSFMLLQAGLLALFFTKYPIFPEYSSVDYLGHVMITKALLAGGTSIPAGLLYYAVHFQLALGVLLTGGTVLVVVQRIMGILAVLGTPIVFLAGSRLFRSRVTGLIASAVYALGAFIWFSGPFASGLYPNFFGILASLFMFVCLVDSLDDPTPKSWAALVMATAMLYFSHYSSVAVLPAVLAAPVFLAARRQLKRRQFVTVGIVILPAAAGLLMFPSMLHLLLGFAANPGGQVIGQTWLSSLLSFWPVLSALVFAMSYDIGFVVLAVLVVIGVRKLIPPRKDPGPLLPLVWFISILIVAPLNQGAWRFAYIALAPLTLLAAYGLTWSSTVARAKKGLSKSFPWRKVLTVVVLLVLVAGTWGATEFNDSVSNTQKSADAQANVYNAITWFGSNTPERSSMLSVSDWRFHYASVLVGRRVGYQFFSTPAGAISFARSHNYTYIAVTYAVTLSLPPDSALFPWNNFPTASNQNLTLVYSNADVRIYQIAAPSA